MKYKVVINAIGVESVTHLKARSMQEAIDIAIEQYHIKYRRTILNIRATLL